MLGINAVMMGRERLIFCVPYAAFTLGKAVIGSDLILQTASLQQRLMSVSRAPSTQPGGRIRVTVKGLRRLAAHQTCRCGGRPTSVHHAQGSACSHCSKCEIQPWTHPRQHPTVE